MNIIDTDINGVKIIIPEKNEDQRGFFLKVYNTNDFVKRQINMKIEEIFYSFSKSKVIRGFHFQNPPYDLEKIVWVTDGKILDVVLDLRKGSKTYGKCYSFEMSANNRKMIYLTKGIAHAFLTLSKHATVFYATSKIFLKEYDSGIRWDSIDFNWPVKNPVLSDKDRNLITFKDFISPFC